jgi:hypothetical protein
LKITSNFSQAIALGLFKKKNNSFLLWGIRRRMDERETIRIEGLNVYIL